MIRMNAGRVLREARLERGFDQATLARRAGTTQAYVSRIERGVVSPSVQTLNRLLSAMGLRLQASLQPLPHGNMTPVELRRDYTQLSPEQRLEQAMELSGFLSEVAASAANRPEDRGSP
jgi:transcriptional regulator with XRE-family HTH domain